MLNKTSKTILEAIKEHNGTSSNGTLTYDVNYKISTIKNHTKKLEEQGFIKNNPCENKPCFSLTKRGELALKDIYGLTDYEMQNF